ncbi:hypothetical protein D3C87_1428450 [compost metagenome]
MQVQRLFEGLWRPRHARRLFWVFGDQHLPEFAGSGPLRLPPVAPRWWSRRRCLVDAACADANSRRRQNLHGAVDRVQPGLEDMARLSELIWVDPAISRDRRPVRTRAAPWRSLKFIDKAQRIDVESGLIAGWEDGGGALPAEVADATAKAGDGFFRQAETLIVEVGERPASGCCSGGCGGGGFCLMRLSAGPTAMFVGQSPFHSRSCAAQ